MIYKYPQYSPLFLNSGLKQLDGATNGKHMQNNCVQHERDSCDNSRLRTKQPGNKTNQQIKQTNKYTSVSIERGVLGSQSISFPDIFPLGKRKGSGEEVGRQYNKEHIIAEYKTMAVPRYFSWLQRCH